VYDGVPLDGVQVRLDGDARIHLAGPVLAPGYVGEPGLPARTFAVDDDGARWLRPNGRSRPADGGRDVSGPGDDVIVTGQVQVAPRAPSRSTTTACGGCARTTSAGSPTACSTCSGARTTSS